MFFNKLAGFPYYFQALEIYFYVGHKYHARSVLWYCPIYGYSFTFSTRSPSTTQKTKMQYSNVTVIYCDQKAQLKFHSTTPFIYLWLDVHVQNQKKKKINNNNPAQTHSPISYIYIYTPLYPFRFDSQRSNRKWRVIIVAIKWQCGWI